MNKNEKEIKMVEEQIKDIEWSLEITQKRMEEYELQLRMNKEYLKRLKE